MSGMNVERRFWMARLCEEIFVDGLRVGSVDHQVSAACGVIIYAHTANGRVCELFAPMEGVTTDELHAQAVRWLVQQNRPDVDSVYNCVACGDHVGPFGECEGCKARAARAAAKRSARGEPIGFNGSIAEVVDP